MHSRLPAILVQLAVLSLVCGAPCSHAAAPFHAPLETSGTMVVKLYPMENVSSGATKLVTFGVPFSRGSVTAAGLAKVRVFKGGTEIPAYVAQLTPWRHVTNTSVDGQSVRVARIQVNYTFSVVYPSSETITVEWGVTNRTQNIATFTNPRNAWHLVTSGTFVSADNVYEPDVYAVLPKAHLAKGLLRPGPLNPFDATVTETRSSPTIMDATEHWPGFVEQEHAAKNNFFSLINQDDPAVTTANLCPYKTGFDPWLYDRSAAMYVLY